jgi:hypothetical protein
MNILKLETNNFQKNIFEMTTFGRNTGPKSLGKISYDGRNLLNSDLDPGLLQSLLQPKLYRLS